MVSIAKALHVPPEEIFRFAGLTPPRRDLPSGFFEWMDLFLSASEEQREELVEYARYQADRRRKKSTQSR